MQAKSGHPGGSLSAADIFTYLYFEEMNMNPSRPDMEGRRSFCIIKGHNAPGLYAVLAERGYFPRRICSRCAKSVLTFRGILI